MSTPTRCEPCHNCRRRRLKCDRALPHCRKCTKTGQECLGYRRLLRWEPGIASRGKMAGLTFDVTNQARPEKPIYSPQLIDAVSTPRQSAMNRYFRESPLLSLTDPVLQDLSHLSRFYLAYFASEVCKDLVVYNVPSQNPFQDLIPASKKHEILLQLIIAISALHVSNAAQKPQIYETMRPLQSRGSTQGAASSSISSTRRSEPYRHALTAKLRALHLFHTALNGFTVADLDVTLAVVLLFIQLELIDSGKDSWKWHINGVSKLINVLGGWNGLAHPTSNRLRRCLISNCLVFAALGSTFSCSALSSMNDFRTNEFLSLLQDAEANYCPSFPGVLLQILLDAAHISHLEQGAPTVEGWTGQKREQAILLLHTAQSFDTQGWAISVQARSPHSDLAYRVHVASAHKTAVCVYLSRVLVLNYPSPPVTVLDLEYLVAEIVAYLSFIEIDNPLFKVTTWPTFIAGAETSDPEQQAWVVTRLLEIYQVAPWGLIREALHVLDLLWRRRIASNLMQGEGAIGHWNWVRELKSIGGDWLIC